MYEINLLDDIKFLESTTNLKSILKTSTGNEPSEKHARNITSCLQQGRLFFEASQSSPLEIKPLQIYYGIVGFSKAITLARTGVELTDLDPYHGLTANISANSSIETLQLEIKAKGTFQHINDVVSRFDDINYFMDSSSTSLVQYKMSLK